MLNVLKLEENLFQGAIIARTALRRKEGQLFLLQGYLHECLWKKKPLEEPDGTALYTSEA